MINASRRDILKAMGFSAAALAVPAAGAKVHEFLIGTSRKYGFDYDPHNFLHIPPEVLSKPPFNDIEFNWKRIALLGESEPIERLAQIHDEGWRAAKPRWFEGHYYGKYDHIEVDGLKLMFRPQRPKPEIVSVDEILKKRFGDRISRPIGEFVVISG